MPETAAPSTRRITGGCQCGAVRYALTGAPQGASVCYCRMCQKALGSPMGVFANLALAQIAWTRGRPALYRSSEAVERGFCRDCGTPLTFKYVDRDRISVTSTSLDDPAAFPPTRAVGIESRLAWLDDLDGLSGRPSLDGLPEAERQRFRSRQHPDHEG